MPQPNDGAFADRLGATRVFRDQRPQHLAVPAFGMFDVEYSMQSEIKALLGRDAKTLQTGIDKAGSRGRRHLDHAKRADRVEAITPASRQASIALPSANDSGTTCSGCASICR